MSQVKARVLKGFRDYLPEAEIPRQHMLRTIVGVFESFGFSPLMTPALEYSDVLLGKYGDEGDKLLYRFEDNGGRDIALRYDLTVPLSRVVAQHGQLDRPFKRYQYAPVWRAEKPGKGRFREFMQCDVDIVGEPSVRADSECMMVGLQVLASLGVPGFVMQVNNRKILDGMLEGLALTDVTTKHAVLRAIDKLSKIGRDGVAAELEREAGLDAAGVATVFEFIGRPVAGVEDILALAETFPEDSPGRVGVAELVELLQIAIGAGFGEQVRVDLTIARGLDYYTGTIYETFVTGHEDYGSVMSGGRYDTLLGMFLKQSVPAVGISVGVDRLLALLHEMDLVQARASVADVYITLMDAADYGPLAGIASTYRAAGLNVELALSPSRMGKQLKRASKRGCRFAVIAGAEERAAGVVAIKDLESGEQESIAVDEAAGWLSKRLG